MVSIAQGLKMMGGGEDLTGYGKTADWLSDRRPQKTALQQLMEMMAKKEDAPGSDIDGIGSDIGTGTTNGSSITITDTAATATNYLLLIVKVRVSFLNFNLISCNIKNTFAGFTG